MKIKPMLQLFDFLVQKNHPDKKNAKNVIKTFQFLKIKKIHQDKIFIKKQKFYVHYCHMILTTMKLRKQEN